MYYGTFIGKDKRERERDSRYIKTMVQTTPFAQVHGGAGIDGKW
jgi:hypothetical protein